MLLELRFFIMSIFECIRNYGFKEHWKILLSNALIILTMMWGPCGGRSGNEEIQTPIIKQREVKVENANDSVGIKMEEICPPEDLIKLILKSEPKTYSEISKEIGFRDIVVVVDVNTGERISVYSKGRESSFEIQAASKLDEKALVEYKKKHNNKARGVLISYKDKAYMASIDIKTSKTLNLIDTKVRGKDFVDGQHLNEINKIMILKDQLKKEYVA